MGFGVGPEPAVVKGPPQPHLQGLLASTCTSLPPLPPEGNLGRESTHPPSVHGNKFPWLETDLDQGQCGAFCIIRITLTPGF